MASAAMASVVDGEDVNEFAVESAWKQLLVNEASAFHVDEIGQSVWFCAGTRSQLP